jgi:dTMP kinase
MFIVFEGIDGSGSSTQASLLKDYLGKQGKKAILSPEPSSGLIGNLIREALRKRLIFTQDQQRFNEQMAYLFAADRHDHLYNDIDGVFKLINDGFYVITTRYYFSSLAYNAHNLEEFAFIQRLNANFPNPDLVIYLDLPIEVSLQRLVERPFKEIYETEAKLKRVRENYQHIFTNYSGLLLKIDATEDKEIIHHKIIDFMKQKI